MNLARVGPVQDKAFKGDPLSTKIISRKNFSCQFDWSVL